MSNDLRKELNESSMSRFQWSAIVVCILLNALDGFDVLVMAFTAAGVSGEWKLNGAQLGVLFSAGLLGMAAGSLLLAPLADRWGRQPVTLLSLVLIASGMLLSGYTRSQHELALMRVLTGLGIGGMLASVTVIIGEYSSDKWRGMNIALYTAGYPLGATIGGLAAAWMLTHYGWRSVFIAGGVATAIMIPIVFWRLPESVDFLIAKRPKAALQKLNGLLSKMGRAPLSQLPVSASQEKTGNSVAGLFRNGLLSTTVLIWLGFFMLMFGFYFALSWTPKLLVSAGLSTTQGITGGVLLNLGGMVGGVLFGAFSVRVHLGRLTAFAMLLAGVNLALFGALSSSLFTAFAVAFAIGVFLFASMAGLYAVTQSSYPVQVRTTGIGYAIGVGRLGAILAPLCAGFFIDAGWTPNKLYYVFALPLFAAMLAMGALAAGSKSASATRLQAAH
ncbi:MFS transporter [Comamonas testosteroni]|uniref:MFS transporter n=1 Tax=Comamonas testosteroni TaxID=285 RepID=A0A373FNK9_COMTE|nr:MFS transporter [Comamonas testosteroni]RGE45736.1 MFS transporter [Comamonas testosteroni]